MRIYTDAEVAKLEKWEQLYFNPQNGEAVQFFPKPEVSEDTPPAFAARQRDRDLYLGTGFFFETPYQKLGTPLNPEAREPQRVAPWNWATADTVAIVQSYLKDLLREKGVEVVAVALAKQNTQFPYLHADGSDLRSRELQVVTSNGVTIRLNVGALATTLAHSITETGQINPATMLADVAGQLDDAGRTNHTDSPALDVDQIVDGE